MESSQSHDELSRRRFLGLAPGALLSPQIHLPRPRPIVTRPNYVIILADDLGYNDFGPDTPDIDAHTNVEFTNFHATPECSPTRAALLAGLYGQRVNVSKALDPDSVNGLKGVRTLPAELRRFGYRTGCFGKWHLGNFQINDGFHPLSNGFDESLCDGWSNDQMTRFGLPVYRNRDFIGDYAGKFEQLTGLFGNAACDFIRQTESRQPFFVFVTPHAPHLPLRPMFPGSSGRGPYYDSVRELNWLYRQIVDTLEASNRLENTVMMFLSDNGAVQFTNLPPDQRGSNFPLTGGKNTTTEGGTRVRAKLRVPRGMLPGAKDFPRTIDAFASVLDIMPTFLSLAGRHRFVGDGMSVWPLISGTAERIVRSNPYLYARTLLLECAAREYEVNGVFRTIKIRFEGEGLSPGQSRLFDTINDPSEQSDLSLVYPGIANRLREDTREFMKTFTNPPLRSNIL